MRAIPRARLVSSLQPILSCNVCRGTDGAHEDPRCERDRGPPPLPSRYRPSSTHPVPQPSRLPQVSGKAEVVAALGQPSTGTHGGAVFEFLVKRKVSKYEKAELLRVEGERLFEEKQVRRPSPASS